MSQHNEASVEEILESIKKVIARDNREGARELQRQREAEGVVRTEEARPAPTPAEEEEVLDLAEMEFAEDHAVDHDNDEDQEDGDSPLTSETVRDSMRDNFAALAMLAEPGAKPQIVRSGETSLEGMVRDMLRPMLAEWLDKNLPGMVEKMVQAEIARIAGKRG
ncbi:hypothetical protein AMC99_02526 [Altererythrobacter epoxidivorans]|uniref:DUF2497 domain-containing protein n=1 Tax=Altererythrobacter epoxidivorans TaxID=361183 RepID=A0A0M5L5P2_9SPHN|nr:DUF2497 domain-containing protein [Altererythrobacter epoxidivorans]ALE17799.1 hypothetical protein AMC99_02526 [Altererythrobacter epoxidivorans]